MKKIFQIILLSALFMSCNDNFMEKYPADKLSPPTYFQTEAELVSYTNAFYHAFPSAYTLFYTAPYYADDDARTSVADEIRGTRVVPNTGGRWNWSQLRTINYYLEHSHQCEDENLRAEYDGLARFFRAYFYLGKIQDFGDVPWYDYILDVDSEGLTKARDDREFVFEKMLEDIDYAIENLRAEKSITRVTKWTALALKSRICLFEGTFRKYHGIPGWEPILDQCIQASEQLMTQSGYELYTGNPNTVYQELFVKESANPKEIILAREYISGLLEHEVNFYTLSSSFGRPGVTRNFVNTYLMTDGSRFTDLDNFEKKTFKEECENRDPRMAQTIRTPGYKRVGETEVSLPDFGSCITGYQYIKYILSTDYDNGGKCTNDMPIFRYAEVLLNFAEAKAERGTLSQQDIDKSIKLLRDRVGMPNLLMANANANLDPYLANQYLNVDQGPNKGVILEIRRERRIELIREGFRWHDLLRWKEGELLERKFYGMYFPGTGTYDLDGDGTTDLEIYEGDKPGNVPGRQYLKLGEDIVFDHYSDGGQIWVNANIEKVWRENRDYFYPIPTQDRILNPNLEQNPNWMDDLGN